MINLERGLGAEQDEVEDLEDDESGLPCRRADAAAVNGKRGLQVKQRVILPALLHFRISLPVPLSFLLRKALSL